MVFGSEDEKYTEEKYRKMFNKKAAKNQKYLYKHRYFAFYKNKGTGKLKNKSAVFVMFNPSHAVPKAGGDDDSISNCKYLARKYGAVEILNLFSLRDSDVVKKSDLYKNSEINKTFIVDYLKSIANSEDFDIVLAWGHGKKEEYKDIIDEVERVLHNSSNVHIIGVDAEKANKIIHHACSQVWNGIGGCKKVAGIVKYNIKK